MASTLTGSWRANPGVHVFERSDFEIKNGLFETASEHVPGIADHLLGPDECVRQVVRDRAKAGIALHGELIEPKMIDKTRVAQPIDGPFRLVGIWDDSRNDT